MEIRTVLTTISTSMAFTMVTYYANCSQYVARSEATVATYVAEILFAEAPNSVYIGAIALSDLYVRKYVSKDAVSTVSGFGFYETIILGTRRTACSNLCGLST